jgi:Gram-negative bacterial TonB protein C-terminal
MRLRSAKLLAACAWSLAAGFFALLAGPAAHAQSAAQTAEIPWGQIETGFAQLAGGDSKAALASFRKARGADDSGLAELLYGLSQAHAEYKRWLPPKGLRGDIQASMRAHELIGAANQHLQRRPIPRDIVSDALARIRQLLRQAPPDESSSLLRPLLCNLRLLADDRATDGEPVLEYRGPASVTGSLVGPRGVFIPSPLLTEAARKAHMNGSMIVEVIVDSEGCVASAKILKPLPYGMVDQAMATLPWHGYEPARLDGKAIAMKYVLTFGYGIS